MDWGSTLPLVLSVVALVISIKALADAKRSRVIAEKTPEAQRPDVAEAVRPGAKAETAASAAAGAQGDDAAADDAAAGPKAEAGTDATESEASESNVELSVQHVENDLYRLTNDGTDPAVNIVFDEDHLPAVFLVRVDGEVSLKQGETVEFLMAGSVDKPLVQELRARWDGRQTPVPLALPVKV